MTTRIALGVDTLSYHCRIEAGDISVEQVIDECLELNADFVQVNAYHLRDRDDTALHALKEYADAVGMRLTLAGAIVGVADHGDEPSDGLARVSEWLEMAHIIGSPFVRVSSGFYRNEFLATPQKIVREQRYLTETLSLIATEAPRPEIVVLLENHSDFLYEEYVQIIEDVGNERVRVFLDVINPVSMLREPLPVVSALAPLATAGHVKDYRMISQYVEDGFHRRGFNVQYCYPGEGVADIRTLVTTVQDSAQRKADEPYFLSIEGLDNYAAVADQRERLTGSLNLLRSILAESQAGTVVLEGQR